MSLIEMKSVSFKYPKSNTYVLNNWSYSFDKSSITSITGSSGSGKSTILMLLAALDNKYTSEILFNNTDLKKLNKNKYRSKNIGIIFQNYNLLFQASAIDNVKMGLYLADEKEHLNTKASELLTGVGITSEKHHRKCIHLSGGEQQRVAIARALSGSPDIIIADEPTGNLDETNQNSIMDIFTKLAKEDNKCVILATHSMQLAQRSDFIISLNNS